MGVHANICVFRGCKSFHEKGGCFRIWVVLSHVKIKFPDLENYGFPTPQWFLFKFNQIIDYSFHMTKGKYQSLGLIKGDCSSQELWGK